MFESKSTPEGALVTFVMNVGAVRSHSTDHCLVEGITEGHQLVEVILFHTKSETVAKVWLSMCDLV